MTCDGGSASTSSNTLSSQPFASRPASALAVRPALRTLLSVTRSTRFAPYKETSSASFFDAPTSKRMFGGAWNVKDFMGIPPDRTPLAGDAPPSGLNDLQI